MDLSNLNSPEMQQFYSQEQQLAMVNEMVAKLTSTCWDKCITGTPGTCVTGKCEGRMDLYFKLSNKQRKWGFGL